MHIFMHTLLMHALLMHTQGKITTLQKELRTVQPRLNEVDSLHTQIKQAKEKADAYSARIEALTASSLSLKRDHDKQNKANNKMQSVLETVSRRSGPDV